MQTFRRLMALYSPKQNDLYPPGEPRPYLYSELERGDAERDAANLYSDWQVIPVEVIGSDPSEIETAERMMDENIKQVLDDFVEVADEVIFEGNMDFVEEMLNRYAKLRGVLAKGALAKLRQYVDAHGWTR